MDQVACASRLSWLAAGRHAEHHPTGERERHGVAVTAEAEERLEGVGHVGQLRLGLPDLVGQVRGRVAPAGPDAVDAAELQVRGDREAVRVQREPLRHHAGLGVRDAERRGVAVVERVLVVADREVRVAAAAGPDVDDARAEHVGDLDGDPAGVHDGRGVGLVGLDATTEVLVDALGGLGPVDLRVRDGLERADGPAELVAVGVALDPVAAEVRGGVADDLLGRAAVGGAGLLVHGLCLLDTSTGWLAVTVCFTTMIHVVKTQGTNSMVRGSPLRVASCR